VLDSRNVFEVALPLRSICIADNIHERKSQPEYFITWTENHLAPKSPFLLLYDSLSDLSSLLSSSRGCFVSWARIPERREGPGIVLGLRGILEGER
jgi:hypothetical protein